MKRTLLTLILSVSCFSLNGMQREAPIEPITQSNRITKFAHEGSTTYTKTLADKSIEEATYNPQYGYSAHKKSAKMKDLGHYSSSDQSQKLFRALEYQYNHQQN